jgi:Skp family chaperone for outer membrane proteins
VAANSVLIDVQLGTHHVMKQLLSKKRRTPGLKELEKIFNDSAALLNRTWTQIEDLKAKIQEERKRKLKNSQSANKREK